MVMDMDKTFLVVFPTREYQFRPQFFSSSVVVVALRAELLFVSRGRCVCCWEFFLPPLFFFVCEIVSD
jgi:hypothetical protein